MNATRRMWAGLALLAAAAPPNAGAVTAAAGWTASAIATPDVVQGGVVRRDGAVLVGQGTFGTQWIVRLDRAGATTVATGFNALGGFALDDAGTLWVADNCGECSGATTGDTVYAIPDALTRTTAVAAADVEALPAGSIPAAQDVTVAPDGAALVTDAAGPGAGRVLRVEGGVATPLVTGLDFLGAVAVFPDGTLRIANLDATFTGAVLRYGLDGTPQGTLAGGLSGAFGLAVDGDQNVLVSGGFADDFSGTIVAVAPGGTVTERARGFGFASDLFHDPERDETLALDFGVARVDVLCRDRDADGVCDCPAVSGAKLKLARLAAPGGDDVVSLKGTMTVPAAPAIDPVTTGARLRIDGAGGSLLDAVIPPGAFDDATGVGWRAKKSKFKWKSPAGVAGITKVTVITGATPGLVKVVAAGKVATLAVAPEDLPLRARVDLAAGDGQCGDLRFPGEACALNVAKGKVICK
jgi:hypothetical protein